MKITSVALTFCITPLFILLCLVTPARALPLQISQLQTSEITLQQIVPQKRGVNAYQKNLDRLRTGLTPSISSPVIPQPTVPQPTVPQPTVSPATNPDEPFQRTSSKSSGKQKNQEQSLTHTIENKQQGQRQGQQQTNHNRLLQSTHPYAIIKAAQQPHLSQTRPTKQIKRINSNRIDPASFVIMVKQTIRDALSPVSDRIQHVQTSLKSALIRLLEQVETKAHAIANQLRRS